MSALPGQPGPGVRLTGVENVFAPGIHPVMVGDFPILFLRDRNGLRAFANLCPHQYIPLDHRAPAALSVDGRVLRCSNHAAGFDSTTGEGVEGLALGCALTPIPIVERPEGVFTAG